MEFPTDAKFSNVQIVPRGNKTLYLNNLPDDVNSVLEKDGENWTVPSQLIPEDYARVTLTSGLAYDSSGDHFQLDKIQLDGTTKPNEFTLKLHGVYRFTYGVSAEDAITNSISDDTSDTDKFYNTPAGYELKESVNNEGKNVFTISPKYGTTNRSITIANATFKIVV